MRRAQFTATPDPLAPWLANDNIPATRPTADDNTTAAPGYAVARGWFTLSIASLVIAGLLSLAVVIGRLPVISEWLADPLFFKRCLVVHVVLALVIWFHASAAAWVALLRPGVAGLRGGQLAFAGASVGVVLLVAAGTLRGVAPVLSNYVPVLDHPLFLAGVGLFFASCAFYFLQTLLLPSTDGVLPAATGAMLRASALVFCAAVATFIAAGSGLPAGLDPHTYFEFLFWGGGHVLQVANIAAMLALWLFLLGGATARPVVSTATATALGGLLVLPHLFAPLLTARGTLNNLYHEGATQLMRWGIFPVVLVVLGLCVRHLVRTGTFARRDWREDPRVIGFLCSAGLTVLGFTLGASIRSANTVVPGHYHASIGAVTAIFMAGAYQFGRIVAPHAWQPAQKWARRQLWLFGGGQAIFALGFALAGIFGAGRKTYGAEQHVRSVGELTGLGVMSVGGLIAVVGGLLFLGLMTRMILAWHRPAPSPANSSTPALT